MSQLGKQLTTQELRCIQAIYFCGNIPKAARYLHVCYDTVNSHVDGIRAKTGLQYLVQITVWAERQGYLEGLERGIFPDSTQNPPIGGR